MSTAIDKVVKAFFKSIELQSKDELLPSPKYISAIVSVVKIPNACRYAMKFTLPHYIYDPSTQICCFVMDDDVNSRDYDQVTDKYDKVFNGGLYHFKFMTYNQLKREYKTFESRRKLVQSFDLFLADTRLAHVLKPVTGKEFLVRGKIPLTVPFRRYVMQKDKERAAARVLEHLKVAKTFYACSGSSFTVRLCNAKQGQQVCEEQVKALIEQLPEQLPGGKENITSIHLSCRGVQPLPVYSSACTEKSYKIAAPVVRSKEPFRTEAEELTTLEDDKLIKFVSADDFVIVDAKTGEVENKQRRKKSKKWLSQRLIEEAEAEEQREL